MSQRDCNSIEQAQSEVCVVAVHMYVVDTSLQQLHTDVVLHDVCLIRTPSNLPELSHSATSRSVSFCREQDPTVCVSYPADKAGAHLASQSPTTSCQASMCWSWSGGRVEHD
jgi:hypothetical protein